MFMEDVEMMAEGEEISERELELERESFVKILRAYVDYQPVALAEIRRRERQFDTLTCEHWALLYDHNLMGEESEEEVRDMVERSRRAKKAMYRHLECMKMAVSRNTELISYIVEPHRDLLAEEAIHETAADERQYSVRSKPSDMEKVKSTLKQFHRDWAAQGRAERRQCYGPMLDELQRRFPAKALTAPSRPPLEETLERERLRNTVNPICDVQSDSNRSNDSRQGRDCQSGHTHSVDTHSGHTHSGHTHSGHTHSGHTHSGHTDSGHSHSGHTHSVDTHIGNGSEGKIAVSHNSHSASSSGEIFVSYRDTAPREAIEVSPPEQEDMRRQRAGVRVLCPGAGLGRLAWEVARLGFDSQGNEFSYYMLLASSFILNTPQTAESFRVFPWIHTLSNAVSHQYQLRPALVPDQLPAMLPPQSEFSMCAGDFLEVYDQPDAWDCVMTCFFIDTAHNIVEYVKTIARILKHGGCWINLGPLLYHWTDMSNEQSIELSLEQVKAVARNCGLTFEREEALEETTYCGNPLSMMQVAYRPYFFVATK